jgi:hypothetical protein
MGCEPSKNADTGNAPKSVKILGVVDSPNAVKP